MTEGSDAGFRAFPIHFIKDAAADEDAFGPHKRIADAIRHVLNENPTIKTIGLLGPWGSGKSTVVKQLSNRLDKSGPTVRSYLFCYDAWLHQSDPPRRSFLEDFVRFLDRECIMLDKKIRGRVEALSKNVEETETTTMPVLTVSGTFVILSALLVPIGLQLISHDWYEISGPNFDAFERIAFSAGLILSIAPIAVGTSILLLNGLHAIRKKARTPVALSDDEDEARDGMSVLAMFSNKSIEKQKHKVVKTPDPTAIEFQALFKDIIEDISASGRRFVIVIDNLDRVHGQEAMALWTTIRSFFLGSKDGGIPELHQPVIILPVDVDAIERAYKQEGYDEDSRLIAQSFMDKTFDITFQVNPPVLSDWKAFLETSMQVVFGAALQPHWAFYVGRFLEKSSINQNPITPRALNVTINKIATFWMQRRAEGINFVSLAYYVIFQDRLTEDLVKELNHPAIELSDVDANWQQTIAAVHYGVGIDKAVQVLIDGRLQRAILDENLSDFKALMAIAGADSVLLDQLEANRQQPSQIYLDNLAALLEANGPTTATWVRAAWLQIRSQYPRSREEKISERAVETIKRLRPTLGDDQMHAFSVDMAARLSGISQTTLSEEPQRVALSRACDALLEACPPHIGPLKIDLRILNNEYLEVLRLLTNGDALHAVNSFQDSMTLSFIAEQLKSPDWTIHSLDKIDAYYRKAPQKNWSSVVSAAGDRIRISGVPADPSYQLAFMVLKTFYDRGVGSGAILEDLISQGHFQGFLDHLIEMDEEAFVWFTALLLSQTKGNLSITLGWGDVLNRIPDLPHRLDLALNSLHWDRSSGELFSAGMDYDGLDAVVRPILTAWLEAANLGLLPIEDIVDDPEAYFNILPPEARATFAVELSRYPIWTEMESAKLNTATSMIFDLILSNAPVDDSHSGRRDALKSLDAVMNSYTVGEWEACIYEGQDPFRFVADIGRHIPERRIESPLSLALGTCRDNVFPNGDLTRVLRWFRLAELIKASNRAVQYKALRDQIVSGNLSVSPDWLRAIGNDFLITGDFEDRADGAVRHLLLPALGSQPGVDWILSAQDVLKGWMEKADSTTREAVADQVSALSNDPASSVGARSQELRKVLNLSAFPANDQDVETGKSA